MSRFQRYLKFRSNLSSAGFTLIELLISMNVALILFWLLIFSFKGITAGVTDRMAQLQMAVAYTDTLNALVRDIKSHPSIDFFATRTPFQLPHDIKLITIIPTVTSDKEYRYAIYTYKSSPPTGYYRHYVTNLDRTLSYRRKYYLGNSFQLSVTPLYHNIPNADPLAILYHWPEAIEITIKTNERDICSYRIVS